MTRQKGWVLLTVTSLLAFMAYILLFVPPTPLGTAHVSAQVPARLCVQFVPATLKALRAGKQQVVVVIKAFTPAKGGGAQSSFVVSFVEPNGQRHVLGHPAVFPLQPFSSSAAWRQQRFSFSLTEVEQLIKDNQLLCLEVGFAAGEAAIGAKAEVAIELANDH